MLRHLLHYFGPEYTCSDLTEYRVLISHYRDEKIDHQDQVEEKYDNVQEYTIDLLPAFFHCIILIEIKVAKRGHDIGTKSFLKI